MCETNSENLFPAECTLRIIANTDDRMLEGIRTTLAEQGYETEPTAGQLSANGSYQTYHATLWIESSEKLQEIIATLSKLNGVRMVL